MKKKHFLAPLLVAGILTIVGCGSFQGISYYSADGIYNPEGNYVAPSTEVVIQDNNTQYYKNYFRDAGREFSDYSGQSTETFTDVDNYVTDTQNPQRSQQMWGSNPSKTNVYILNNPNAWAFSAYRPFGFVDPWLWNDFYYGPGALNYRFGGWGNRFSYWNRGFYDPFYSPWDPINRWGWGWGSHPHRYWDRYNRYYGFYGVPNYDYRQERNQRRSYSRVNSNRGERTQTNTRRSSAALGSLGGDPVEVPRLTSRSNTSRLGTYYGRVRGGTNSSGNSEGVIKSRSAANQSISPKQTGRQRSYNSGLSRAQQQYLNRKIQSDIDRSSNGRSRRPSASSTSNQSSSRRSYNNSNFSSSNSSSGRSRSTYSSGSSSSRRSSGSPSRGSSTAGRSRSGGR